MADLSKLRFNGTDYNVKDASAPLRKFTNYSKTGNLPITSDDTTQTAIGKLEKALDDKINTSAKGTSNGVAELDANGKVPSSQLPSYVDDVLEYSAKSSFPATGETGKIYVDTTTNKTYRWSGSAYVEISESLALGETSSTAYRGDRGKAAYDHSQITNGNPHGTTGANTKLTGYSKGSSKDAVAATDTVNAAIAKHENRIDANQTNILLVQSLNGAKNCIKIWPISDWTGIPSGLTISINSEGAYVFNGTVSSGYKYIRIGSLEFQANTTYYMYHSALESGGYVYTADDKLASSLGNNYTYTANGTTGVIIRIGMLSASATYNNEVIKPMIITKAVYDAGFTDYQPYALPNYDLTYLEAEDRAALAEVVDSGAKNLLPNKGQMSHGDVTFTWNNDGSVTISGTKTAGAECYVNVIDNVPYSNMGLKASDTIVLSNNGTNAYISVIFWASGSGYTSAVTAVNETKPVILPTDKTNILIRLTVKSDVASVSEIIKPMICTKAAFGVSNKFVPYRPNYDLVLSQLSRVPFYVGQNGNDNYFGVIITGPNRGSYSIDFMSNNGVNGFGNIIVSAFYSNGTWNVHVNTDASYNVTMKIYSISSTSMAIMFYASNKWAGFTISGGSTDQMTIYRSSNAPSWTEITQQPFPT